MRPRVCAGYDTPLLLALLSLAALVPDALPCEGSPAELTGLPFPALTVQRYEASGIYRIGETVGWRFTVPAGHSTRGYRYSIKKNDFTPVARGELRFADGVSTLELRGTEPQMLYVEILSPLAERPLLLGAAVAPERLAPAVPRPADFTHFWRGKLAELAAVPPQPVLTAGASGRTGVEYAILTMATVEGAHIHGQVARPSAGGPFPGLVIFQYAGGPYPLQKEWVTDRAAEGWLAVNIEPHDVLPDQPQAYYDALPEEIKSYQKIGVQDRDSSYFLRMYLSDYRTIEYLAARPDWDGRTLAVIGMSMGGQQSLCAAALNRRVTAVMVDVPAGADSNGPLHGRMSGYPNWPTDDARARVAALYFDTVNCASEIRAPTLVALGFTDTTSPPAGNWAMFNQIRAPKEIVAMVDSPHNNFATPEQHRPWLDRSAQWLEALQETGKPPLAAR